MIAQVVGTFVYDWLWINPMCFQWSNGV